MLLTGAKLDAKLAEIGSGGGSKAFSRSMALRRWHGKIGPWANVSYRLELWRVRPSEASTFLLTLIILDSKLHDATSTPSSDGFACACRASHNRNLSLSAESMMHITSYQDPSCPAENRSR